MGADYSPHTRPVRRRWHLILLCSILFVPALLGGVYCFFAISADRALDAAIAETDLLDPRWRLEDIEADRAIVPNERNSGLTAIRAKQLLPGKWPVWDYPDKEADSAAEAKREALAKSFSEGEPQEQLNAEQINVLRVELKRAAPALAEARKLADMPTGRYPITYAPDFTSTLIPYTQDTWVIAKLLSYDADLRAQDEDADGALESCRAIVNAGRSIGDEPIGISLLVRIGCVTVALRRAERVLAEGQPSDDALLQFQQLLEKEEAEPLLVICFRGERAGHDRFMDGMRTGNANLPDASVARWIPGVVQDRQAASLRYMNRAVEIAKLPPEQQQGPLNQLQDELEVKVRKQWELVLIRLHMSGLTKIASAWQRHEAQLRCAIVVLAAERYRRAKGQWPDKLDTLTEAGFLSKTPIDVYDGQPLRLKRLDDGLVVYSVGPDGQDNGGHINRQDPTAKGTDLGFRLWDVAKRRQPPARPKPPEGPNELPLPPENGK